MKIINKFFASKFAKWFKKIWTSGWKYLDRALYRGTYRQFMLLFILLFVVSLVFFCIGNSIGIGELRIVELILDPGSFTGSDEEKVPENRKRISILFQLFVTLFGAVTFTCLLINTIGNWLERRIERYRNGGIAYDVDDHILIIGGGCKVVSLIKTLLDDVENAKRDIVILTSIDAEEVRARVFSEIPKNKKRNIYVYYGSRVRAETLNKLDAYQTRAIYILGEDDEPAHDSLNMKCYELLRDDVCKQTQQTIDCYLVLDRLTSTQLFFYKSKYDKSKLHLTVVNSLENAAQQLLVSRYYRDGKYYPSLDRGGIGKESNMSVHLIVVSMSQMGYMIAITAAHICHFPNFRKRGIRTKITFIQNDIKQEMDFFLGRYHELMNLSYWKYINSKDSSLDKENFPDEEYVDLTNDSKGFLDIEWEFVDGGIEECGVRNYIEKCASCEGKSEYLTIAFCHEEPETNTAAALFLPEIISENQIPIFVYQPGGDQMIRAVTDTPRYKNIYPFGMKSDCWDIQYKERILQARRIKYLYNLADKGEDFYIMPSDIELIKPWFEFQYAFQQSNIYASNSIAFKLRSIANDGSRALTEEEIDSLSETEHNRWNVERLLIGFKPYKIKERKAFVGALTSGNPITVKTMKEKLTEAKNNWFMHKDIAPYDELLDSSKKYDKFIVKNIIEVIKDGSTE